jgi:O-antigen ligase
MWKKAISYARFICISLFAFLLPTQLGKHFFLDFSFINGIRIDYLAPTIHVTDILALLIIALYPLLVYKLFNKRPLVYSIGIFILTIIFSHVPWLGIYRLAKGFEWLGVFAVFAHLYKKDASIFKGLMMAFLFGTLLELLDATLQLSYKQSMQGIFYWLGERRLSLTTPDVAVATINGPLFLRPYATFSHPNSMGGFYLLLYFFILVVPGFRSLPRVRSVTAFLCMLLVFLSFSKTVIAVFVVLNIAIFIDVILKGKCRFCGISRFVILIAVAAIFSLSHGDPYTIEKRITLIDNAFDMILKHPIFGVGMGNYLVEQSKYTNHYSSFFLQPVHNIVLLFLAETGIVGGGGIFALFYKEFLKLIRHRSFQFCFAAVFLTGMLDHYWLTLQQNFLLTAVVFGILSQLEN